LREDFRMAELIAHLLGYKAPIILLGRYQRLGGNYNVHNRQCGFGYRNTSVL
jgi:hypothetical protein